MWKYSAVICLLLLASAGVLSAQGYPLPNATVGTPYEYDFLSGVDLSMIEAELQQLGYQLTLSFSVASGNLPPGITTSNLLSFSGTPTTPGTYNFTANLTEVLIYMGQSLFNVSYPIPFSITVTGSAGPTLTVTPGALSFPLTQGSTATMTQSVLISNKGPQAQTAAVSVSTSSGPGNWLSASGGGAVGPFSTSSVMVTANPNGLPAGTYTGTVSISLSPSGQTSMVGVTATVSSAAQRIVIPQSGARFQAAAG